MAKLTLTKEEKDVLRKGMCIGWGEPYFEEFVARCEATGLSPFKQQVYGRLQSTYEGGQYVQKLVFIASIGALRSIAEETGRFRGRTEPLFAGEELKESHQTQEALRGELRSVGRQIIAATDQNGLALAKARQEAIQDVLDREGKNEAGIWKGVWTGERPPFAAKVGVRSVDSSGNEHITYHTAKFSAYVQTKKNGDPTGLWGGELRDNQLAKCAEGGALRAAFPDELGGVYTVEEMANKMSPGEQDELGKIQNVGVRGQKEVPQAAQRQAVPTPPERQTNETVEGGRGNETRLEQNGLEQKSPKQGDAGKADAGANKGGGERTLDTPWNYGTEGNPLDVQITASVSRVFALHGKAIRGLSEENVRFFAKVSVRGGDEDKIRFYRALYQVVPAWDDEVPFEDEVARLDEVFRDRVSKNLVIRAEVEGNGSGEKLEEHIENARKRQSYATEKKQQEFVQVEKIENVGRAVKVKIGEGTAFVPQSQARDADEPGKVSIPKWLFDEKQREAVEQPQRRSASVRR